MLAIEVLRALQVSEARTPTMAYPLANDEKVRTALQFAINELTNNDPKPTPPVHQCTRCATCGKCYVCQGCICLAPG